MPDTRHLYQAFFSQINPNLIAIPEIVEVYCTNLYGGSFK